MSIKVKVIEYQKVGDVLQHLAESLSPDCKVIGFSITAKEEHSTRKISWGDNRTTKVPTGAELIHLSEVEDAAG